MIATEIAEIASARGEPPPAEIDTPEHLGDSIHQIATSYLDIVGPSEDVEIISRQADCLAAKFIHAKLEGRVKAIGLTLLPNSHMSLYWQVIEELNYSVWQVYGDIRNNVTLRDLPWRPAMSSAYVGVTWDDDVYVAVGFTGWDAEIVPILHPFPPADKLWLV